MYQRSVRFSFAPFSSLKSSFGVCSFTPLWPDREDVLVTLQLLGFRAGPELEIPQNAACQHRGVSTSCSLAAYSRDE